MEYVTVSAKTRIICTNVLIKKTKFKDYLHMLQENIYKDWWNQQSAKEASNHQKLHTILLTWLWQVQKTSVLFL